MSSPFIRRSHTLIRGLLALLVLKVIVVTVLSYRDYMPPNFEVAFLIGREGHFYEGYQLAFYPHIVVGPLSLLLGMLLLSERFRRWKPRWHRLLGRVQVGIVLLIVAPSGLAMAQHASSGPWAGWGFASLALATSVTVVLGWRAAVQRRFEDHRRWMQRCFALLFSAVVIRVNGGMGLVLGIEAEWYYLQSAWTSWLLPVLVLELWRRNFT